MDLEQQVLERIVPSPEQVRSIEDKAARLKGLVESYVAAHGIDAEVRFAGSFSKNTYLSDPDLDTFLMFPPETSPEDVKRIGLQAGEDILHGERMFSDHPYTRGKFEGVDVDMVPCYRIDSTEHLLSAVDRTPFHTEFIRNALDEDGCNQVRLLKRFMKGIGTYGAEQDSRGFSGYLCELMVVKYGSFRKVLENASRYRDGVSVDIRGPGPRMKAPMVFYDPVDVRRNAASAVHLDTLARFIVASREYLREPRMEFFFPNPRTPMTRGELEAKADADGARIVAAVFRRPDAIEDNLQSQLWKTQYALERKLDNFGFEMLRAAHRMDGDSMTVAFEVARDTLDSAFRHRGPPVWVDSEPFLARWRDNPHGEPFIEDGCWTVIADRQYTSAAEMLGREAAVAGIGREMDPGSMEVLDHAEALERVDAGLLTELLDPRFPWENRAKDY
ncbi:MAG: CCA tRNA nucleotidyltransferase [Thermoplasmata archaeon]|nr:CCA tRNA nucleotidyltransferase [Thermoplasmata archaeon]